MLKILARDWMASATLFSKPEYVWTTNHCLFVVVASLLISDSFPSTQDPLDAPRQHDVHHAEEHRQDHRDHDDDHGGVDQLLPARPGDLAELRQDLQHELPESRDRLHPPASRPSVRRSVAGVEGFEPPSPGFPSEGVSPPLRLPRGCAGKAR